MYKSNELLQLSIKYWKEGWPSYFVIIEADSAPMFSIVEKLCGSLRIDILQSSGRQRIMTVIKSIASYCGKSQDWRDKNLYRIDQALSTVMQEVIAAHKLYQEQEASRSSAERIYQQQKADRERADLEADLKSQALKQEHEATWTDQDEVAYQAYMKKIEPGKVVAFELAKEKHINRAL